MKKIKFIFIRGIMALVAMIVMVGCGKNTGRTLTSATGSIYECLVVMNENPLTQEQLNEVAKLSLVNEASGYTEPVTTTYDLVEAVMAADMPCMPQVEPYFRLTHVPTAQFDDMFKPTRNILFVDINPQKYTQLKAKVSNDYWSTPQAICRIQSPSEEEFVAYWLEHGTEIREWFVNQEIKRQMKFYRASTNKEARTILQKQGYDMLIPEDYIVIMDTTLGGATTYSLRNPITVAPEVRLLWCCNNKGSMRRDIVVYSYPYTDENTFTLDYLNAKRDAVLSRVVTASVDGSYMGTEYKVFPPQMRAITVQEDEYATEVRGLWKILDGEAMGGPYVSHTRLDQVNGRVVTAETFLYAAGQKKRSALRQAEAILYTLQLPQDTIK
ncbi:MAG: DUF4837 family protein [Paludibacteraceae bacterium]|nr:DUF4837 family protein [Paludibacteraceae bacterium]